MPRTKTTTPTRDPRAAALYLRVSTGRQVRNDMSLPAQQGAIEKYAYAKGLRIVKVYTEPGASARDDNRPVFKQMMQDVLDGRSEVSAILVLSLSRFMRDSMTSQLHKRRLRASGVDVVAIQQEVAEGPSGNLMEHVFEAFDQFESEVIGDRTRNAMSENARRGFANGSRPPFGYRRERVDGPWDRAKSRFVVEPNEADVVREAFNLYVSGLGGKGVARDLNRREILHRGNPWDRNKVLALVENTAYVGRLVWGKRDARGAPRPEAQWVTTAVEPIVELELFDLARSVRTRRDPHRNPGRLSSSPLLLAGLLHCERCGATYQLETATNGSGNEKRYYNCRTYFRIGKEACPGRRIPVEVLDRAVLNHVADQLFTEDRCKAILRAFVEEQGLLRKQGEERRRLLQRERDDAQRRLSKWYERIETDSTLDAAAGDRIRELKERLDHLRADMEKATLPCGVPPYLYKPDTIARFRAKLQDAFKSGAGGVAGTYLRQLIDKIVVGSEEITIEAKAAEVIAMMAGGASGSGGADPGKRPGDETAAGAVHTDVHGWRAREDSNFRLSVP